VNKYSNDLARWATEQAAALRARRFNELDVENLAEEIEDLAKSDRRALRSHFSGLLAHLLKWQQASAQDRDLAGRGWLQSIVNHRVEIGVILEDSPSLLASLKDPAWLARAWTDGVKKSGLAQAALECPWDPRDVLRDDWLPVGQ
jgi:hypothetical protein